MQLESSHYLVSRAERSRDSRADRSTDSGADSCTDSRTDRQGQTGRQAGAEAGGEHDVPAAVEVAVHAVRAALIDVGRERHDVHAHCDSGAFDFGERAQFTEDARGDGLYVRVDPHRGHSATTVLQKSSGRLARVDREGDRPGGDEGELARLRVSDPDDVMATTEGELTAVVEQRWFLHRHLRKYT